MGKKETFVFCVFFTQDGGKGFVWHYLGLTLNLISLTLQCLMYTKTSYILNQTCSFQLQVCLSMCDLLVDIRH